MTSFKTNETVSLKILMIQRAVTAEQLADRCGVKKITIYDQTAKNFPSRRLRLLVESALDQPFWSSPVDFAARRQLAATWGFDPFTVPAARLREFAAELKLRGRSAARRRSDLTAMIQEHFSNAANSNTTQLT
jgi:hypothetical protein